jgi:predicted ATPase
VLSCRCPAYGQGITFWPLRELVEQATGGHRPADIAALLAGHDGADAVAAHLAAAVGTSDEPDAGRDMFPAARRLFEVLGTHGPVAVVVDDAHWGQPTFLDLLDHLTDAVRAPLLVVCLARPELLDARPGWAASPHGPDPLVLAPLSPQDSERLAADRLAGRLVPDEVVSEVVELAQGNPLFIEQLVASLRDEGKLRFPPSVHALLSARLDRLGPAERDVLRCASVIGTTFWLDALAALVPAPLRTVLERHLDTLRRKELVDPAPRTLLGRPGFTFRHALVQQAAYRTTTRQTRAELHERLADWIDRQDAPDLDEVVAHHLEQAHDQRLTLGLADEATRALARRAGERLARCGLHAYRRFDMTAAEQLLSRARALLPADHPDRHEVLRRLAEAYPTLGRLADAEAVLTEMLEQPPSPRDEQRLRLEQLRVRLIAGPDPVRLDAVHAEVERAIAMLEPVGDDVGMSQACYLLATMHLRAGRIRDLEEVARRGLEHARRSGDLRELLGAMWFPAWALVAGPTPVPEAIRGCEQLLRDGPGEHVGVVTDLARLHAMRGASDTARELIARGRRQVVERVRVRRALTVVAQRSAEVEALAGDLAAAEAVLRPGVEVALDVGERDQSAQVAAALALVLCARGSSEEAATFAALAQRQAPAESVVAQALWRAATGRVLATGKDDASARRLVREAIALVPDDLLNLRADLQLDLAVTLDAGGRPDAAAAARREAADLYRRKGNVAGVRRASGSGTSGSRS